MEGKASGFHIFKRVVTPTISSGGRSSENSAGEDNNNSNNNSNNGGGGSVCMVREQDRYMPIANVIRIMRRILPSHAKISDDAKETIQECVSEYISFITSEANERCQREQRKTITAEDVLWAMGKLGFEEYVGPLSHFLNRYRDYEGDRSSVRGDPLVKRSIEMAHIVSAAGYGPAGPSFHIAPHQGMLTPPIASAGPPGYFRDAGNGNSGQTSVACYDPYAQYR